MDKNENIIPQIIYLMILNINYSNTFDKSKFKFKNYIYYLDVYDIRFVILMLNKRFIYFINHITHKSKNIFVILFYYLYYFYFYFKFIISKSQEVMMFLSFFLWF